MPDNQYFHFFQPQFRIGLAILLSMALSDYAIPIIIRIAKAKKLFDMPDERKKHRSCVPTMGGLAIYATIVTVSLTMINTCGMNGVATSSLSSLPPIIAGFTVIFFIGMKDDLLNISAWKRLMVEVIALFILSVIGEVRLHHLQGMFYITEIGYFPSIALSIFTGIVIINAFNLIDGIDGLAASIAMLGSVVFGVYFFMTNELEYSVFAAIILGSLIPYFIYNVYGKKNKIFMGDTGSLILGFAMTVLVFRFNQMTAVQQTRLNFVAAPAFSFAVLIIPLFDTLRVFTLRLSRGQSPFKADRGHLHHLLLDLGFNHIQSTATLAGVNAAFVAFAYFFNYLGNQTLIILMLVLATLLCGLAVQIRKKKQLASLAQ